MAWLPNTVMKDFTLTATKTLLTALLQKNFHFIPFCEAKKIIKPSSVILRHDVDLLPENALQTALIEHELGIKATYNFRILPNTFNEEVIKKIYELGHEIGYHYEDLTLTGGNYEEAIESFRNNLEKLRTLCPVKTACMHGSPLSKYDSRLLWKYYNYKDFGIEMEPYFDISFENMLYLTDTGRRWNGRAVSIRDKANNFHRRNIKTQTLIENNPEPGTGNREPLLPPGGDVSRRLSEGPHEPYSDWKVKPVPGSLMNKTEKSTRFQSNYIYRSTYQIIRAAENGTLPARLMITFHPQRWTNAPLPWLKELLWQNTKNIAKYFIVKFR